MGRIKRVRRVACRTSDGSQAHYIFIPSARSSYYSQINAPAQVVKVSALSEGCWHVAILIIPRWLTWEVYQAFFNTQFLLHSPRMLFCCAMLARCLLHFHLPILTGIFLERSLRLEVQPILVVLPSQALRETFRIENFHLDTSYYLGEGLRMRKVAAPMEMRPAF